MSRKGGNFFPFVVFMDADGLVLGEPFFPEKQESFDEAAAAARKDVEFIAGYRKAATEKPDDKAAQANLALILAGFQRGDAPELEKLDEIAKTPGIAPEAAERFAAYRVGALKARNMKKMEPAFEKANKMSEEGKEREEIMEFLGGEFYKMMKEGMSFDKSDEEGITFYMFAVRGAIAAKDKDSATSAMKSLNATIDAIVPEQNRGRIRDQIGVEDFQKKIDAIGAKEEPKADK